MSSAQADNLAVTDVIFEGLQRVSAGSAMNASGLEVGDIVNDQDLGAVIGRLYRTGFFRDVKVFSDEDTGAVKILVVEQPSISKLEFDGNKKIPSSVLKQVLKDARIQEGEVFNRGGLDQIVVELERQYAAMGRYNAAITTEVTALPRNRVGLMIDIDEGSVAKISTLAIVGNQVFTDKQLLKALRLQPTKTGALLQRMTGRNKFATEKARSDQEALKAYYLDRGFLRFELVSTQVAISEDRNHVHITYNVKEGERFYLDDIKVTGDLVNDDDNLKALVGLNSGDMFSRRDVSQVQQALQKRLTDIGYAFANIRALPDVDEENKKVSINFFVEPGKRTYVRNINITGNESTNDDVIRRELVQMEGALASGENINVSRAKLQRTDFFSAVQFETVPVPGVDDQVDINLKVKEKRDGTLTGSVGYADPGGFFVKGQYEQDNFRGSGKNIKTSITEDQATRAVSFSYEDPYFTLDGVSLNYELFYNETDFSELTENRYGTNTWGGGLSFGYPLNRHQRISYGIEYKRTELSANKPALEIQQFIDENGENFDNFNFNATWRHNNLNGGFNATKGQSHYLTLETTLPFSDLQFYRVNYGSSFYHEVGGNYVMRLRSNLGYGAPLGDASAIPFFENFRSGGVSVSNQAYNVVRGYRFGSLGPVNTPAVDDVDPAAFGGNIQIGYGIDFFFPMPLVEDKSSFKTSLFIDAGNVFTDHCIDANTNCTEGVDFDDIRYSYGFELDWITPIAPLRFIWAWPIDKKEGDKTQSFTFTFGYQF